MRLVLASSSPRRVEILATLGLEFDVEHPDVDESRRPDESPDALVERLARDKALAVAREGVVAVGADTVVVHGGRVLGKPVHPDQARSMLQRLQGGRHEVFTGLAVCAPRGEVYSLVDMTVVTLMAITDNEIDDYVNRGEPMGKAGGYALQGEGSRFVEAVAGSPYTVIGLPVHLLGRLLARAGHDIGEFRRSLPP